MTRSTFTRFFTFLVLACGAASTCSCTSVLGIEDTRLEESSTTDPAEDWSCVGNVTVPQATAADITITVATAEFIQVEPTPLAGVEMTVCPAYDDTCQSGTTPVASDDTGVVTAIVKIPKDGFAGYLQFKKAGYTTLLWQFSRKPTADFSLQVLMVSEAGFAGLRQSLGVPVDPQFGHLTFSVVTCAVDAHGIPVPARGVEVNVALRNEESKRFYAVGAGFESDTTQPATGESGRGGIFNLNPVTNKLLVTLPGQTGATLSEAGGLFIRADTISTIDMLPRAK